VQELLEALGVALTALGRVDPIEFADREIVVQLERSYARHEAIVTRAVGAFETSKEWHKDEAASATDWLTARVKLPSNVSRRQVRLGRAVQVLPVFERMWLSGDITGAHVDVVGRIRRFENEGELAQDEATLCRKAITAPFSRFAREVRSWEAEHDPSGAEAKAELLRDKREVWLSASHDDSWFGKMVLDPVSGAIVHNELDRIERAFFEADWAQAKEQLGKDPTIYELCRTKSQRCADALVEMATRSASMPPDSRRPEPLFTVLVNYEQLHGRICQLAQGTAVSPGSLVPWLDQAVIERAVFTPDKRVEISETSRLFTGATRRAIEVRDLQCTHPLCEAPAERCEADHITPYSAGGLTTQDNGRLLCAFHNRLAWENRDARPPPDP
jgi:hypothetical protein